MMRTTKVSLITFSGFVILETYVLANMPDIAKAARNPEGFSAYAASFQYIQKFHATAALLLIISMVCLLATAFKRLMSRPLRGGDRHIRNQIIGSAVGTLAGDHSPITQGAVSISTGRGLLFSQDERLALETIIGYIDTTTLEHDKKIEARILVKCVEKESESGNDRGEVRPFLRKLLDLVKESRPVTESVLSAVNLLQKFA